MVFMLKIYTLSLFVRSSASRKCIAWKSNKMLKLYSFVTSSLIIQNDSVSEQFPRFKLVNRSTIVFTNSPGDVKTGRQLILSTFVKKKKTGYCRIGCFSICSHYKRCFQLILDL